MVPLDVDVKSEARAAAFFARLSKEELRQESPFVEVLLIGPLTWNCNKISASMAWL